MQLLSEKILFFDLAISGHHVEYLYHLIKYRIAHPECPEFVLLTHPEFMERVAALNLPGEWQESGISVIHPSTEGMQRLEATRSVFSRADEELRILHNTAEKHKTKCCYLMMLNKFQFVLGTDHAQNFPCVIRGILFNPFSAMDDGGHFAETCKSRVLKFRKHLQTLWMLRNKKIDHIYVLNDPDSAQYLNSRYHKKNLFVALPDPILIPPGYFDHQDSDVKRNSSSRRRFLLFGSLSSRKGIFQVIDALRCIPETVAKQIEVIFAGKVVDEESERFRSVVADLQRDRPKIKITLHDEFIPYEKIPALLLGIDCVLLPYTSTGASSGLIGHSALYGKPVIGPARGLIGQLIRHYGLGMDIAPVTASNIAAAMKTFIDNDKAFVDQTGMRKFVEERHPNHFVATLLGS